MGDHLDKTPCAVLHGKSGWRCEHHSRLPPLLYKCCMWIEFQSISTWLGGFSPGTPVSSLLKIDSQSNPSGCGAGCGAVLRSHIWIVLRGRAPSRQHSSFGLTSLSCALCNSVYELRETVISRSTILLMCVQFCCGRLPFKKQVSDSCFSLQTTPDILARHVQTVYTGYRASVLFCRSYNFFLNCWWRFHE